jgi:hypothetical protein
VEILPPTVATIGGNPFELRVRLKDASGYVLPDDRAAGTRWTSDDPRVSISSSGDNTPADARAFLKASPSGVAVPAITVRAQIGERSGTAQIKIIPSGAPNPDWVAGDHESGQPPTIALMAGQTSVDDVKEGISAFVGEGPLAKFKAGIGEVTVFSRHRRVASATTSWTDNCDEVVLKTTAGIPPTVPACQPLTPLVHDPAWDVPIRIFILASDPVATNARVTDVPYALAAFDDAWSGLKLSTTIEPALGLDTDLIVLLSNPSCADPRPEYDVRKQLELAGVDPAAFDPKKVTVAYVQAIHDEGSEWGPNGIACTWSSSNGAIIVIPKLGYVHTTLAHELGHVFGLWHSDELSEVPPFDMSNLMWAAESNLTITSRGGLTLGQTFRMSRGKGSFIERLGGSIVDCAAFPSPCPRIRKDIIEP